MITTREKHNPLIIGAILIVAEKIHFHNQRSSYAKPWYFLIQHVTIKIRRCHVIPLDQTKAVWTNFDEFLNPEHVLEEFAKFWKYVKYYDKNKGCSENVNMIMLLSSFHYRRINSITFIRRLPHNHAIKTINLGLERQLCYLSYILI